MDFTLLFGDKSSIRLKIRTCSSLYLSCFSHLHCYWWGQFLWKERFGKGTQCVPTDFALPFCVFTFLMLLSHAQNSFSHQKLSLPTPKRIVYKKWKIWACKHAIHFLKFLRSGQYLRIMTYLNHKICHLKLVKQCYWNRWVRSQI